MVGFLSFLFDYNLYSAHVVERTLDPLRSKKSAKKLPISQNPTLKLMNMMLGAQSTQRAAAQATAAKFRQNLAAVAWAAADESRSRTEAAHAKWPGTSFGRWAQGGDNGRKVVAPCDELAVIREFVNGE